MMSRRFLLLLLLLVPAVMLMSATVVRAEEELDDAAEDVVVPGGDAAEGSEEVTTTDGEEATSEEAADPTRGIDAKVIFPGHEDLKFAAGEPAVALIGFRNGGEVDVTVEVIEGSLRYPQDVKFHVQNFTRVGYREKVAPNTEATFLYRFRPHESFDPRDFHFVLTAIFSTGENQYFSVSPFNSTIAVTDAETSFDSKRLFSNIFLVAGAVFAVIFFLQKRTKKSGKQAAPKIETGTSDTQENEWLENMNQVPQRSPKPKSPKPKKD